MENPIKALNEAQIKALNEAMNELGRVAEKSTASWKEFNEAAKAYKEKSGSSETLISKTN